MLDPLRADPWNGEPRELAASVYYPAVDVAGCPVAPYTTAGAAAVFVRLDAVYLHPELPTEGVDWTAVRTHAHVGPPPAAGPWPVVVYSPGGGDPRALATSTAEELASHGRVVITVDHPGDSSEIEYPDGRVRTMAVTADPRVDLPTLRTAITARVADLGTVLDVVFAAGTWPPTGGTVVVGGTVPEGLRLDPARVGVMGHSGGATAATQAMHDDPRVRAGVNLEGYLDYIPAGTGELLPVAREGLDRPLLLLGTDGFRDARLDRTWLPPARRDTTELVPQPR
ncbi:hypothetical protein AB0I60_22400 [Actinosynnema sp. NPDC050436]|uniref:alpha/beta hydrolase n=1 Tax=Actinosynnema sp. NPDC050436 TaxID=3155659 RepID=UPI0033C32131